ncbi:TPA: hypothetical protein ACRNDK_002656 [Pseudomonas aeruginosa]
MNVRIIYAFLTVLLSAPAFANGLDDASSYRVELVASINELIFIFAFIIGLILMISGAYKMKLAVEENGRVGWGVPIIFILVGALFINLESSLSTFTNTFFSVDFCKIVEKETISSSCFKDEISGLTGTLKDRIEKMSSDSTAQKFMDDIEIIVGLFQVIGFIYFLVGAYGLTQVANGSSKDGGYGKPIITMIASALIVDVPHTASVFIDTLNKIGINF